jgi:ribonuclease HI
LNDFINNYKFYLFWLFKKYVDKLKLVPFNNILNKNNNKFNNLFIDKGESFYFYYLKRANVESDHNDMCDTEACIDKRNQIYSDNSVNKGIAGIDELEELMDPDQLMEMKEDLVEYEKKKVYKLMGNNLREIDEKDLHRYDYEMLKKLIDKETKNNKYYRQLKGIGDLSKSTELDLPKNFFASNRKDKKKDVVQLDEEKDIHVKIPSELVDVGRSTGVLVSKHVDSITLMDEIDRFAARNFKLRRDIERTHRTCTFVSVACWNMQSLNKKYNLRQNKIEFLRDAINENKFDFVYLIDVNDIDNRLVVNGYNKFGDQRNYLFVKYNIYNSFIISRNCFVDKQSKLAFVYLTPLSRDSILVNNIIALVQAGYTIVGDINLKSNPKLCKYTYGFFGEDTLQTGFVTKKCVRKVVSITAPSDHCFIYGQVKCDISIDFPMRLKEVSFAYTTRMVAQICQGIVPKEKPLVKPIQYYLNLNDREKTINAMIDDYFHNNVAKIYKRYRSVYFIGSKEPFLGTRVNDNVVKTFAKHLKADEGKRYLDIPLVPKSDWFSKTLSIRKTKSKAVTFDYMQLNNISEGLRLFLDGAYSKTERDIDGLKRVYFDIDDVINNVLKVATFLKEATVANTFFLLKNKRLQDYNDVRMIVIMPGFIKIFETLIYNLVTQFFSDFFARDKFGIRKTPYQYGGLKGGSTYMAMLNLRMRFQEKNAIGVLLLDLAKGYDTVDMSILLDCVTEFIDDEDIRRVLVSWITLIYNLDYVMNQTRVKRTHGIAMGLALSPIIFEFYLDCALRDVDKGKLTCYVDDMAIILEPDEKGGSNVDANKEFINKVVSSLEKFQLVVNKKKSVVLTRDVELSNELAKDYTVVDEEKYLGRLVRVNGDGKLVPDDRFFNKKAFRSVTCPFWVNYFTKKLVFNNGVMAKFAYGLYMFATSDRSIRNAAFRDAWFFLKTNMGKFRHMQSVFSITNYFRFFIDSKDMVDWITRKNNGENPRVIDDEVRKKLALDIPQLKGAIERIVPIWNTSIETGVGVLRQTKEFNDHLWVAFKKNLLHDYMQQKRNENVDFYPSIIKFMRSRWFAHCGLLQNVVFKHIDPAKRSKQIALWLFLKSLSNKLLDKLTYMELGVPTKPYIDIKEVYDSIDPVVEGNYKDLENEQWETMMKGKFQELWPLIDKLLFVEINSRGKIPEDKDGKPYKDKEDFAILFVDGSYNPRNNKIGYAGLLFPPGDDNPVPYKYADWEYDDQEMTDGLKNIYGELRATIVGLEEAVKRKYIGVNLHYDYAGIESYARFEWAANSQFISLYVAKMREFRQHLEINFIKVKSHSGDRLNDIVDGMAKLACDIKNIKVKKKDKNMATEDVIFLKKLYKDLFKLLVICDMTFMNNLLNDLTVSEILYNMRIKFINLEDLALRQLKAALVEDILINEEYGVFNDILDGNVGDGLV